MYRLPALVYFERWKAAPDTARGQAARGRWLALRGLGCPRPSTGEPGEVPRGATRAWARLRERPGFLNRGHRKYLKGLGEA